MKDSITVSGQFNQKNNCYAKPDIDIIDFSYSDIIRTSGCDPVGCDSFDCPTRDNDPFSLLNRN